MSWNWKKELMDLAEILDVGKDVDFSRLNEASPMKGLMDDITATSADMDRALARSVENALKTNCREKPYFIVLLEQLRSSQEGSPTSKMAAANLEAFTKAVMASNIAKEKDNYLKQLQSALLDVSSEATWANNAAKEKDYYLKQLQGALSKLSYEATTVSKIAEAAKAYKNAEASMTSKIAEAAKACKITESTMASKIAEAAKACKTAEATMASRIAKEKDYWKQVQDLNLKISSVVANEKKIAEGKQQQQYRKEIQDALLLRS